jgi:hypothetical protein
VSGVRSVRGVRGASEPPTNIAGIAVPQDPVSSAAWRHVERHLPRYLLSHSVRAYCWGAAIAAGEGWSFDARILWIASLFHDIGLTRIPRNRDCFEVSGAAVARRFTRRSGLSGGEADRIAVAIVMHMQPSVTVADGIESVLLDRATSVDVRGDGYVSVAMVRAAVSHDYPRDDFDRLFLRAIEREVVVRSDCQSTRLFHGVGLAGWMARSPWRTTGP